MSHAGLTFVVALTIPFTLTDLASRPTSTSVISTEQVASPTAALGVVGDLTIECPDELKVVCGESLDPANLGTPIVTGGCDEPVVTFEDVPIALTSCAAERFDSDIIRVWTATDSCGNSVSCTQTIHVLKRLIYLDIKTQSCPNPVNVNSGGTVSVSILGTADFDVTKISLTDLRFFSLHCEDGPVVPIAANYEDTGTPFTGGIGSCNCHTLGGDGILDLQLKFSKAALVDGLGLGTYPANSFVKLVMVGETSDGCGFIGIDCVRVQHTGN